MKEVRFLCSFLLSRSLICESSSPDDACSLLPSDPASDCKGSAGELTMVNTFVKVPIVRTIISGVNDYDESLITSLYKEYHSIQLQDQIEGHFI